MAEAAARRGWSVLLNDHLHSAVTVAAARLASRGSARFSQLGGYDRAIEVLNSVVPFKGFIFRQYTPASAALVGFERRYFSEENGALIDAVRAQIRRWSGDGSINEIEERVLIADLIGAVNRVANIAGTYGCFLSRWQAGALSRLELRPRDFLDVDCDVEISVSDAAEVATTPRDVVYIDPPYTKRQYAAYYHLIETVTLGDEPEVEGITGLRPWRHKASDFCYKTRALKAFVSLVEGLRAERLLISYSDEGHVAVDTLVAALRARAKVLPVRLDDIPRYRPNKAALAGREEVHEYLIEVTRELLRVAA